MQTVDVLSNPMNKLAWAATACLMFVICGCGSKVSSPLDGTFKNNAYTNRFFGIGMRIPETWTVLPKPSTREVRKGGEVILGSNKVAMAALMDDPSEVHHLLRAKHLDSGKSVAVLAE